MPDPHDGGPASDRQPPADPAASAPTDGMGRLWRAGRTGWALLGVAGVVALGAWLLGQLSLVVVPVVLALFPATLLVPVAAWLRRRGLPDALAAAVALVGALLLLGGVLAGMVPLVRGELPDLVDSAADGVAQLQQALESGVLGIQIQEGDGLLGAARDQLGQLSDYTGEAVAAATAAFETFAGLAVLLVSLFFYLKDGRRLARGLVATAPSRWRSQLWAAAERAWTTLGAYFRGQLLVALVDAVAIGIGLLLLRVPLAVPLSVLIFFGGMFPIIGAVTTGALAVLVATADAGLGTGLAVLAVVVGVQQLESNLLEPVILGHVIALHPMVVLVSITAGAIVLGVLGAFLAVPVAAITARILDMVRAEGPDAAAAGEA